MASRRPNSARAPAPASVDGHAPDGDPGSVVRRAPFADNPEVGARGQRTQQRILDAALRVFDEVGYHQCGIGRITEVAGCSRASFYQYFSGKQDVYRHLTGQVVRQLGASIEVLDPLTSDADSWSTLQAWIARHGDIYERYEPVYKAFPAAAESDEAVAVGSTRVSERNVAILRSKLVTTTLSPRQLDPVLKLLLECLTRTHDAAGILRSTSPEDYPRERVDDALADVVHRTLFGLRADVNVHPPADRRPEPLTFGPVMQEVIQRDDQERALTATGRRTLEALTEAGRDVFVARGYHNTRVDDVVSAAGVSHGAFYRYFTSKDHLAHVLAGRAVRTVSTVFDNAPAAAEGEGSPERAALRQWLRRYNATQATETAMIRVWIDAGVQDPGLRAESAALLDWGRRRMVRFLQPRDFGDVEIEAVVMTALLSAFGRRERPASTVDAATYVVERGFLGH